MSTPEGEMIPVIWEYDDDHPQWIRGHCARDVVDAALSVYGYDPADFAEIRESYGRCVPTRGGEFDSRLFESTKGPGAFAITIAYRRETK